jgi:hypothetical protein
VPADAASRIETFATGLASFSSIFITASLSISIGFSISSGDFFLLFPKIVLNAPLNSLLRSRVISIDSFAGVPFFIFSIVELSMVSILLKNIYSDFLNWSSVGDYLSPLATEYRYPNELEIIEPSQQEVQEAFKMASDFYNFVLSKLPIETHP